MEHQDFMAHREFIAHQDLKEKCDRIVEKIKAQLFEYRPCIAAYLLGSASHDKLWEWSDIQIAVVLDDGYKGKPYYTLLEDGMCVALNIYTLTAWKEFIGTMRADDFMWKAFSKCSKIFSKDFLLDELLTDTFWVGDVDRQKEMLLGFSGAVYYLNKAEKNFYVKENLANTIYFIPMIAENIAWIEIFKNREIPERELIPQGRKINPQVFKRVYDPLFPEDAWTYPVSGKTQNNPVPGEMQNHPLSGKIQNTPLSPENSSHIHTLPAHPAIQTQTETRAGMMPDSYRGKIKNILENCVSYLEENTRLVYQPILSYLEKHDNLEGFCYETRPHGFGINYEWLVRCGIAARYGIPEKIPFLKQAERLGYCLIEEPNPKDTE